MIHLAAIVAWLSVVPGATSGYPLPPLPPSNQSPSALSDRINAANTAITSGRYHGLSLSPAPAPIDGGVATYATTSDAGVGATFGAVFPDGGVEVFGVRGPLRPRGTATGPVERYMVDDLDERGVNVKNFGACGDGGCDDTAAFAMAWDAGGNPYVPPGDYNIESTIIVSGHDRVMYGAGGTLSRIHVSIPGVNDGGNANAFVMNSDTAHGGPSKITFRDLDFVGENSPFVYHSLWPSSVIYVRNSDDITVERCRFENLFGFSFHSAGGSTRLNFSNNTVLNAAGEVNVNGDYSTVANNYIQNSQCIEDTGIQQVIAGNVLNFCYVEGIAYGGAGYLQPGGVVSNNTIISAGQGGIGGGIAIGDGIYDATVSNNTVINTASSLHAISFGTAGFWPIDRVTVTGNRIHNDQLALPDGGSSPSLSIGVYLPPGTNADHITISNNQIDGMLYGIAVAIPDTVISSNRITGSGLHDIELQNATNTLLDPTNLYSSLSTIGTTSFIETPAPYSPTPDLGNVSGSVNVFVYGSRLVKMTLTGNSALAFHLTDDSHLPQGQEFTVVLVQGSGGSHALTGATADNPTTSILWAGGSLPTLSTSAGAIDIFRFRYDSVIGFYEVSRSMNVH